MNAVDCYGLPKQAGPQHNSRNNSPPLDTLNEDVEVLAPLGPGVDLGAVGVNLVPVVLTETGVKVDLVNAQPTLTLPEVTAGPEEKDDGKGEAGLEEVLGGTGTRLARGSDGNEDLGSKNDTAHGETSPGTTNTEGGLEGDAVHGAALGVPGLTEANVGLFV